MNVPRSRAPVRLAAANCPLAFGCDCTGACPLEPYRGATLPKMANPAAVGGFLDDITGAISGAYQSVTTGIADVFTTPVTGGDLTNITFAGSKYPTSQIFTPEFVGIRTQNSLQGLANDIASGIALPRDDGSVSTRDNKSTIAPAGSVYVSFFQSKGVQVLSSASAPQVAEPTTPTVLNSILSGISFGILGGGAGSPTDVTATAPAGTGAPTTGPAWVDPSFLAVSTQPRLDRIIADLASGAAVVLTDGSVGVPQAGGAYTIIAPIGSINVALYSMQTGRATVAPKGTTGAVTTAGTSTVGGLLKSIGNIFQTGATQAATLWTQQQLASLAPKPAAATPVVTPAQLQAQAQVSTLSQQLAQAQAQLQQQQAAAASAAQQAQQQAAIAQLQQQLQLAQQQAAAAQAAAAVSTPLISSGIVSGPVTTPAYIPPTSSVSTPDFSGVLASVLGSAPAQPGTPQAAIAAPVQASITGGGGLSLPVIVIGLIVLGGGAFFLYRRRGMAPASRGRSYRSRPIRRRRRRAYA